MTIFKLANILPCAVFFRAGRFALGVLALLMQLSLIFWPLASQWARESSNRAGVQKLLAELSEKHGITPEHTAPKKRFRQLA